MAQVWPFTCCTASSRCTIRLEWTRSRWCEDMRWRCSRKCPYEYMNEFGFQFVFVFCYFLLSCKQPGSIDLHRYCMRICRVHYRYIHGKSMVHVYIHIVVVYVETHRCVYTKAVMKFHIWISNARLWNIIIPSHMSCSVIRAWLTNCHIWALCWNEQVRFFSYSKERRENLAKTLLLIIVQHSGGREERHPSAEQTARRFRIETFNAFNSALRFVHT